MTTATLTRQQERLRDLVLANGAPAERTLLQELEDGTPLTDVRAVAEDLCPGSGEEYRR